MADEHEPCKCPTDYCEYDSGIVKELGGGETIKAAARDAKELAEAKAIRVAEEARAQAMVKGDTVCKGSCVAWFKVVIGKPKSQEYPYHSDEMQFAFGWCSWTVVVKCEKPGVPVKQGKSAEKGKTGKAVSKPEKPSPESDPPKLTPKTAPSNGIAPVPGSNAPPLPPKKQ